jgi:hypothetical protein
MFVFTLVSVLTKSVMLFVKQEVAQLSIAIWNESESYRVVDGCPLAAVKQQSTNCLW